MAKKLTLSMDEAVIEAAKEYANKNGTSLSNMVENFFRNATQSATSKTKKNSSSTPHMDAIREIQKKRRTPQEEQQYLEDLYKRKPHMKEWFKIMDEKLGYT